MQANEPNVIALPVVTGHDGTWLTHECKAFGIKGELGPDGEQRWYDSMETLLQFHPEIAALVAQC